MDFTISCTTILEYLKLYGSVMHHEIQILMHRKGSIAGCWGSHPNSKQWYEEPLHTLPHNNVQKLNI